MLGHTPGSISVILSNGEIIVGNLIMRGYIPLVATQPCSVHWR